MTFSTFLLEGKKPPLSERKVRPLEEVLAYENRHVEQRFLTLYDVTEDEAADLFREVRRYLWACAMCTRGLAPTPILDKMWHNFILFTPQYINFCNDYFGYFVHHHPADKIARAERRELDPEEFRAKFVADLEEQLQWIEDLLGPETLIRWYVEHPVRYGNDFFKRCTKVPEVRDPKLDPTLLALVDRAEDE